MGGGEKWRRAAKAPGFVVAQAQMERKAANEDKQRKIVELVHKDAGEGCKQARVRGDGGHDAVEKYQPGGY